MSARAKASARAIVAWLEEDDVQELESAHGHTRGAWVYVNLTNQLEPDEQWVERAQHLLVDAEQNLEHVLGELEEVLRTIARRAATQSRR